MISVSENLFVELECVRYCMRRGYLIVNTVTDLKKISECTSDSHHPMSRVCYINCNHLGSRLRLWILKGAMAAKVGVIWLRVRGEYFQMSFVKVRQKIEKNTCDICFIEM